MSPRTRASLVSDIFSFSEANYINGPKAFELSQYLTNEVDFLPWNTFIRRVSFFLNIFDSTSTFARMQSYLSDLARVYYNKLGWIEDAQNDLWTDRFDYYL